MDSTISSWSFPSQQQQQLLSFPSVAVFDYILLFEHVVSLCAKFGSVLLMSSLVYLAHFCKGKLRVDSLSPCMQLYLMAHTVCSALGIPYVFYMLFWAIPHIWSGLHDSPYYSANVLFWTGILEISYITAAPFLVTLLTLERCIILNSTNLNVLWPRRMLFIVGLCTFVALWAFTLMFYLRELPLQMDKISNCKTASCETIRTLSIHSTGPKVVVGLVNIICCAIFLRMLRSVGPTVNLKNRVVKFTIVCEIFLNTLPALGASFSTCGQMRFSITGLVSANYVGELSISACPVDAFICALIYWRILVKSSGGAVLRRQSTVAATAVKSPPIGIPPKVVDNSSSSNRRETLQQQHQQRRLTSKF